MATIRQNQIAELIKRHFSVVLQQEGGYIYGSNCLVTVADVQMTPDFSVARIYLSILGNENKQEVVLTMREEYTRLRTSLAKRIKSHVRRIPELLFFIDDTVDEMYRIEEMLKNIEVKDNNEQE